MLCLWKNNTVDRKSAHSPLKLFEMALKAHMNIVEATNTGLERMKAFDVDFVADMVQQLLECVGGAPNQEADPPRPCLTLSAKVLQTAIEEVSPSSLNLQLLLARVHYLNGKFDEAQE